MIIEVCGWTMTLVLWITTLWQVGEARLQVTQIREEADVSRKIFAHLAGVQIVSRGQTLPFTKILESSLDCEYYWVLFAQGDFVWPQTAIKNTHQPDQQIDVDVTVPEDFCAGELILVAVSDGAHEKFDKWLKEGRSAALLKPAYRKVIFSEPIMTREGGSQ